METYIFIAVSKSYVKRYNRTITLWRVKNNKPERIGEDNRIHTASYKGDHAVACQVIADNTNHKMAKCGYILASKNIRVYDISTAETSNYR